MSKFLLLAAAVLIAKKKKHQRQWWKERLTLEGRQRRDRRYPRSALRAYNESSFKYMFDSSSDQALLNACGVDHQEFLQLLGLFQPLFDAHTFDEQTGEVFRKKQIGRPRSIDAVGALGMLLMWYRTKGPLNRSFPLIFGVTNSPMHRWLKLSKVCLLKALQKYKPTAPTAQQCEAYCEAIASR